MFSPATFSNLMAEPLPLLPAPVWSAAHVYVCVGWCSGGTMHASRSVESSNPGTVTAAEEQRENLEPRTFTETSLAEHFAENYDRPETDQQSRLPVPCTALHTPSPPPRGASSKACACKPASRRGPPPGYRT